MRRIFLIASGVLATALASVGAHAAEDRWQQGFGQGNLEFFIDHAGLRLYLGCMTEEGVQSYVSLYPTKGGADEPRFRIAVAGMRFDAPFETASRVGANNYYALLQALRTAPATVSFRGKAIVFPVTGAAEAIPEGVKATVCQTF